MIEAICIVILILLFIAGLYLFFGGWKRIIKEWRYSDACERFSYIVAILIGAFVIFLGGYPFIS